MEKMTKIDTCKKQNILVMRLNNMCVYKTPHK